MIHDKCSINRHYSDYYHCCTIVEGAFISLVDGNLPDQTGEMVAYTYKTSQTHTLSNDPLESDDTCIIFFFLIILKTRKSGFHQKITR